MCSVNALLCMLYAHEGVWAGADLDEDPQPTMEAVEPQQTASSTGGFSEAVTTGTPSAPRSECRVPVPAIQLAYMSSGTGSSKHATRISPSGHAA